MAYSIYFIKQAKNVASLTVKPIKRVCKSCFKNCSIIQYCSTDLKLKIRFCRDFYWIPWRNCFLQLFCNGHIILLPIHKSTSQALSTYPITGNHPYIIQKFKKIKKHLCTEASWNFASFFRKEGAYFSNRNRYLINVTGIKIMTFS